MRPDELGFWSWADEAIKDLRAKLFELKLQRVKYKPDLVMLRDLKPGDVVAYADWRGDYGTAEVIDPLNEANRLNLQRHGFVGPRVFFPTVGDGDVVELLHKKER